MSKEPRTYAFYDVARSDVLRLITTERASYLQTAGFSTSLKGTTKGCTEASNTALTEWRKVAKDAKLLSICSHGKTNSIDSCVDLVTIYELGVVAYPEVKGAIIHLLACAARPDLTDELYVAGGASAAIGYAEPFVAWYGDQPPDENTPNLPPRVAAAVDADCQILVALASGRSVKEAVDAAIEFSETETAKVDREIQLLEKTPAREEILNLLWTRTNLQTAMFGLGYSGLGLANVNSNEAERRIMTTAKTLLLYFVADLIRSESAIALPQSVEDLWEAFKENPEAVMNTSGLPHSKQAILLTSDRQVIGETIKEELLAVTSGLFDTAGNAAPSGLIFPLLADLVRGELKSESPKIEKLATQYGKAPDQVLKLYGVKDAPAIAALQSRDRERICEYIRTEFLTTNVEEVALWGDLIPRLVIAGGTPGQPFPLAAAPAQKLTLRLQCALSDAEVHLIRSNTFGHIVGTVKTPPPWGLLGQAIEVEFDLTGAKGDYRVVLYNERLERPIEEANQRQVHVG